MAETENKYVKKISDEKKLAIINESVQNLSARPTSNATDMKKRFVMPIVNKDGKHCLADEVDRVAGEADKAIKDVHGELDVKALQITLVNQKTDNNAADIKTLQGNVTELSDNDADQKTRLEAVESRITDTENGLNAVANQASSNAEDIREIDYTINNALAANIKVSVDENYVVAVQLLNKGGLELGSQAKIDLPMEELIISGSFDEATKQIVLVTREGKEIKVPVGDLVDGLLSSSEKGQPNGVASLDENGKVPTEQLPEGIGGGLPEGFNPDDYVKNTDYASYNKAGVVRTSNTRGTSASAIDGTLQIEKASDAEIDTATSTYKPIVASNYKYAVKKGITTNTETLTDEEKTSACDWLGAVQRSQPASGIRLYGSNNVKQTTYDLNQDGAVVLEGNSLKTVPLSGIGGGVKLYKHYVYVEMDPTDPDAPRFTHTIISFRSEVYLNNEEIYQDWLNGKITAFYPGLGGRVLDIYGSITDVYSIVGDSISNDPLALSGVIRSDDVEEVE